MASKKQMLQQLSFDVNEDKVTYNPYQRIVMDGIESLNDFKRTLEHEMNKYLCLSKQTDKGLQWFHGEPYRVTAFTCSDNMLSLIQLASFVGYELNIYNGCAHMETK